MPYDLLQTINEPADLRKLDRKALGELATELRAFVLESVSRTGGHLSSNLGTVELTIALHYVFNTPEDRIVWDVGHQSYPHKILTGRRGEMNRIRMLGGISGFPRRSESPYDTFGTAHSSTSISAALGMAVAARRKGENRRAIAVIGDGAMSAGMAFEAMNNVVDADADVLVILNDNDMSISPSLGGMNRYLARLVSGRFYNAARRAAEKVLSPVPPLWEFAKKVEEHAKGLVVPSTLFEELGFNYIGPIDGHDLDSLLPTLKNIKELKGPQFLHIVTRKGQGYKLAEADPVLYHGVSKFEPTAGIAGGKAGGKPSFTQVFGDWLCDMAEKDPRLVGITPAMREGSGLVAFEQRFPERYFDVGIAEQHAVTFAAGLACEGMKPVVAIYSTFLQRAYDQFIHDVQVQNLPVLFALDRAGLVGADGPTHAGSFDVGYLGALPGFVVMAAGDANELSRMVATAAAIDDCPSAFRYPRGDAAGVLGADAHLPLEIGKGRVLREGTKVALVNFGARLQECERAADKLAAMGLSTTLADARFAKPLDEDLIARLAREHEVLLTVEEGAMGGFGAFVLHFLARSGGLDRGLKIRTLTLPDVFQDQDKPEAMYVEAGLDADAIAGAALTALGRGVNEVRA